MKIFILILMFGFLFFLLFEGKHTNLTFESKARNSIQKYIKTAYPSYYISRIDIWNIERREEYYEIFVDIVKHNEPWINKCGHVYLNKKAEIIKWDLSK